MMIYAEGRVIEDWPQVIDAATCAGEMGIAGDFDEVEFANLPIEWWMEFAVMEGSFG